MTSIEVRVPDLGGASAVSVIELLATVGSSVAREQSLLTVEGDKTTMEIPAPAAGRLQSWAVKVGDQVNEGQLLAVLESAAETSAAVSADAPQPTERAAPTKPQVAAAASTAKGNDLTCDLLVLGAGPGGYTAAFRAADLGLDVILVERYPTLGGVCLNVGCIPSKALLHVGRVIDEASEFAHLGVHFGAPQIELGALRGYKDRVIGKLTAGLTAMAKQRKVRVLHGRGEFSDAHQVVVNGEQRVGFKQAVIAVGSQSVKLPNMPWGDPRLWDSTAALELHQQPKRLLIIGGGIIGLEMACVHAALGSEVSVVELAPQLMPGADADLVKPLQQRLSKHLQSIRLGTRVSAVHAAESALEVQIDGQEGRESYDAVLVAVGRRANGDRIAAERAGVLVDGRGQIAVDHQMRTNVGHIYAIGDVVGQPMLAHKATHEGKIAAEVAAGLKRAFDARVIPSVAYTDPEIAWVGLTETEAKAQGVSYERAVFPHMASGRAIGVNRTEGLTKLLVDPQTKRLLGGGIVAPSAGDLISELALAIEVGGEVGDIALTIHPHPTFGETVAMAAEVYEGTITDLYLPKKPARH